MSRITPNQREAIAAIDDLSGDTFYVGGSAVDKSINVNITGDIVVGDINLSKVGGAAISLGQKTSANSLPVVIASNQSALSVSQSGAWNITNISGTISLPTNAAMETGGNLDYLLGIDTNTSAISSAITNGSQKSQIVDGSGNVIGSTANALDVNIKSAASITVNGTVTANQGGTWNLNNISGTISLPTGASTSANQTNGSQLTQIVDAGGDAVTVTGGKLDVNAVISGSGGGTSSIDNSAFTAGTDSGTPTMGFYHSTIDTVTDGRVATVGMTSKRGMFVNLQTAAGAETGVAATPLQVSLANTGANTNKLLVTPDSVALPANQSVNVSQINGVTPLMGNGVTGTGSQRVTISSDNTAFSVNATLSAETTKVIGTVRNADGAGNLWTSNSTTYTAKFAQDMNILGTLGTAFSTAGKVDIKGADGDVFVRQATASNLNATVVQGTGSNLHTVIDSGTITAVTSITNQVDTNLKQVAGANTLAGNGASGTGAQRVTIASDSTGQVAPAANATATGTSIYNNTALSSTKQAANASAGNLYGYHIYNPNSVVIYVQMFNVASAGVTVGSTTPTAVIAVPAFGWADATPATPIAFATALTIAATTTSTGSGTPGTALLANFWYK